MMRDPRWTAGTIQLPSSSIDACVYKCLEGDPLMCCRKDVVIWGQGLKRGALEWMRYDPLEWWMGDASSVVSAERVVVSDIMNVGF